MADFSHIRTLHPGDEPMLEAFLRQHIDSSLFLLSNLRAAGLEDRGERFQGTYVAAFDGGAIAGVVGLFWNGTLLFQAPVHAAELARTARAAASRPTARLIGPMDQVQQALDDMHLRTADLQWDDPQVLFSLALDRLAAPEALGSGRLHGRRSAPADVELLTAWRVASRTEMEGIEDSAELRQETRRNVEAYLASGRQWVLEASGVPVSTCTFNAEIPDLVQIGGVYTPPEQRNCGYARAVVAAALLDAQAEGVRRAVLFTGQENHPAQKAYEALGFRRIGQYRLTSLRVPIV